MRPPQPVHVHDPATHLEGADGRVVFVLHPHFASGALVSRGHEYCGVGGTNRWTSSAADSSSAKEGSVGTVAKDMWIRCTVGQIGHIFEDLPNPLTTGTERAHRIITATMYLFAPSR